MGGRSWRRSLPLPPSARHPTPWGGWRPFPTTWWTRRGCGAGRGRAAQLPARLAARDRVPARHGDLQRRGLRKGGRATSIGCGARRRWSSNRRRAFYVYRLHMAGARADRRGRRLLGGRVRPRPDQEAREDASRQGRRPHPTHPGAARADRSGVPHLSRVAPGGRGGGRRHGPAAALRLHRRRRRAARGLERARGRGPGARAGLRGDPGALHRRWPPSRGQRLPHAPGAEGRGARRTRPVPRRRLPRLPDAGAALPPRRARPQRPHAGGLPGRAGRAVHGEPGRRGRAGRRGLVAMYLDGGWSTIDLGAPPAGAGARRRPRREPAAGRRAHAAARHRRRPNRQAHRLRRRHPRHRGAASGSWTAAGSPWPSRCIRCRWTT